MRRAATRALSTSQRCWRRSTLCAPRSRRVTGPSEISEPEMANDDESDEDFDRPWRRGAPVTLPRDAHLPRARMPGALPVRKRPWPRQHRAALPERGYPHPADGHTPQTRRYLHRNRRYVVRDHRHPAHPTLRSPGVAFRDRVGQHRPGGTLHRCAGSSSPGLDYWAMALHRRAGSVLVSVYFAEHHGGLAAGGPLHYRGRPRHGDDEDGGAL